MIITEISNFFYTVLATVFQIILQIYSQILPKVSSSINIPTNNKVQELENIFFTKDFCSGLMLGSVFTLFLIGLLSKSES